MQPQLCHRPRRYLAKQIIGGIGKGGKDDDFLVARIYGLANFGLNDGLEFLQFGIAQCVNALGIRHKVLKLETVFLQILLPAHQVHILYQHFDLAADQQGIKFRRIQFDVFNTEFFNLAGLVFLDFVEQGIDLCQQGFDGEPKGVDRAFHTLEQIDPHQVNQALFAVCLLEYALTAFDLHVVFAAVFFALVHAHVFERRICAQVQTADGAVDVMQGRELVLQVYISLDVVRFEPYRKFSNICGAVVFLNVFA